MELDPHISRSSVTQDQRSELPKEYVWWFLLAMLMTPPWRASVITLTRRHCGLSIARLAIHVTSRTLAHARRVQRAHGQGITPTSTLTMNVSRQMRLSKADISLVKDIGDNYYFMSVRYCWLPWKTSFIRQVQQKIGYPVIFISKFLFISLSILSFLMGFFSFNLAQCDFSCLFQLCTKNKFTNVVILGYFLFIVYYFYMTELKTHKHTSNETSINKTVLCIYTLQHVPRPPKQKIV